MLLQIDARDLQMDQFVYCAQEREAKRVVMVWQSRDRVFFELRGEDQIHNVCPFHQLTLEVLS